MNRLIYDLRYAVRQLRRAPGFAVTVVLTLALSVGLATAVFCVIDAVILRPLPFSQPQRIVAINTTSRQGYTQPASWPSFKDEREQAQTFAALAGYNNFFHMTMQTESGAPVLLPTVHASDNFFDVFGVKPILGRTFLPGEQQEGKNQVAVLSYEVWQTYFNGAQNVLSRSVTLDGRAYSIIGVMPAGFRYPLGMREGIYTPRLVDHDWMQNRGNHWMRTIARIRDGETREHAQADLNRVLSSIGAAYPESDAGRKAQLVPIADAVAGQTKGPLWTLLGAVLAVLAIGCVNIAGLLLARGVRREREMAMRAAIGASRARIIRQVLTEGILLALLGAAGGAGLASALLSAMRVFLIKALSRGADVHMNWAVLTASIAAAITASLAASLYPALRMSRVNPNTALKSGASVGNSRGQHRLRSAFVVTQVALTLVLLLVAGLLIRVVTRYRHADLGFEPARILATDISMSRARYEGRDIQTAFYQPFLERVRQIPGVRAAGLISTLPIENWGSNSDIHIAGQPPYPKNQEMLSEVRFVTEGYFDVFGIPLRGGRRLDAGLDSGQSHANNVVVNDAFVKKFIPASMNPVGQHMDDNPKPEEQTQIVGVVGNIRQNLYGPPLAEHDYLIDEMPVKIKNDLLTSMTMVVRFDNSQESVVPAIRAALHDVDPTVPFHEARTMTDVVSETLIFERMEGWLFGVFAALALGLALVGLFGLLSHEMELSTRDIGVRMALGASRGKVLAAIMRRVAWMLAGGIAAGILLAFVLRQLIGVVIYFDAQKEAVSVVSVALLLAAAGALASLIPAMRAASVEPMQALRNE
jgi:predicted permease